MIRPNELRNPGEQAAWRRVETLFADLDALGPAVPLVQVRSRLSAQDRDILIDRAETLVDGLGRGELLDAATDHLDAALSARLAGPVYRYSTNAARPEELAAIARAMRDLLLVTVVEDRLAPADADRLGAAGRFLLGRDPGGGAAEPSPATLEIPEPTEADWADADAGPEAVDPDASPVGSRSMVAVGIWLTALLAAAALLAAGVVGGDITLGLIGAVIAVLVGGTLARGR